MSNKLRSILYITCGLLIVSISAGALIFRLAVAALGFYFIYSGLKLRNPNNIVYFSQFGNKFRSHF